ncbi:uncharacterized protein LOC129759917 [Uranotaenia lowii]|uniref:uncharacterized protein LOC129759917 n=1 Tax=Uranotaenia lowii TaxID=190385 RepID=UPI00247B0D69|nr:uncharacterized protein LOC129759917 [Uranotaenia lowii]XP_055613467.1 uncharacterized protein LOC129759917 [Uranotaenia lowii]
MIRRVLHNALKLHKATGTMRTISTAPRLRGTGSEITGISISEQERADAYLTILKDATDPREVLDFLPKLDKRKINRQSVTLAALKSLFELHKLGKTAIDRQEILHHPRFAELCRALKLDARSLIMNDITEILKILTYFGVRTNSEIMTVLLNLLRLQINDVSLDHIVFLDFILKKMDRTPLVEALQMALPMLLQIQISYKMDHENVQQLVDLLHFVSNKNMANRCVTNLVSALTLHGTNLNAAQAVEILKALLMFTDFQQVHLKLLDNVFQVVTSNIKGINFKTIDFVMKQIVEKNLDKYPMFYNEVFFKACSDLIIEQDLGIINALYILKKFNKILYIDVPLLNYVSEHVESFSIVPVTGIITFVSSLSNANYKPSNWDSLKPEINRFAGVFNTKLPWIRYNLELLSLDIYNFEMLQNYLSPETVNVAMDRKTVVDHLQLLELDQTLRLLYPQYHGPFPPQEYLDTAKKLLEQNRDMPLEKPLELIFGQQVVLTKVKSKNGHVFDHVLAFDESRNPIQLSEEPGTIETLLIAGREIIVVLCLPPSYYATNVNRMRGRFVMQLKTIETLGVKVVPISYQMWNKLPEAERLPFLEREVKTKLQ